MIHLMKAYFAYVSVSEHCIFPKNAFVWNAFLSDFRFEYVFQHLLKHNQQKTDFYSVFGSVTAVWSLSTVFLVSNQLIYFGLHVDPTS